MERTKNATKNIFFGTILKIYQILVPFLIRTIMIYFLGVEYTGLNSLFCSVLQVLNLAELGVGSAMVFSMYKPIAIGDTKKICSLMELYKLYYRIIGGIVLITGLIICPFIPYLIKGDVPADMNIYVLYLLNLSATVLSYWLYAYKNSVLQAHQRTDVISKVTLFVNTIQYILQILVICFFKNYYLYVLILLFSQICINILTAYKSHKLYPDYKAKGKLNQKEIKDINQHVKDLFTAKLGAIIVNSSDSIVISSFLGLTMLTIYQNYFYILTAIIGFVTVILNSCTAGIGNSLIVETKEKNFNDLKKFTYIIVWIAGFGSCCLLCLYQDFIEIWVGKDLLLDFPCVICLVIYYLVYEISSLLLLYKDAGGIWHADRFRPLVTALTNLALNLILVNFIGIYGIILSTVLSTVIIGMPWLLHNLFTQLFDLKDMKQYICELFKYLVVIFALSIIIYLITNFITGVSVFTLLLKGFICLFLFNILFYIIFNRKREFIETKKLVIKMFHRKGN